ncbi:MAG TPA: SgcJ/EcaC family oxidoreductase, partial [Xanthobacteraceae bacterium]|nr:SgcJ/EcaC family oxidoreductase [Xanthobacteraceae bacterium]
MSPDELAIRELVETWMTASRAGDTATVLSLMADDVVFMVPGREPFGKEGFAASSQSMKGFRLDGKADIRELKVLGDWA